MQATLTLIGWLLAGLGTVTVLGALLARSRARQDLRRIQAHQLTQALQRYSAWVAAQRVAAAFRGEAPAAGAALEQARTLRTRCFPELRAAMDELLAVHERLLNFLAARQSLWQHEPRHGLESEHDRRYMALWRQHRSALQALLGRLQEVAGVRLPPVPARGSSCA